MVTRVGRRLSHEPSMVDLFRLFGRGIRTALRDASTDDAAFARHLPKTSAYSLRDEYTTCVLRGPAADQLKIIRNEHALDICETYPLELVIPSATTDLELRRVAAYRSKGRLPVIIWSHPTNGATISRSSQPKPGVQNKRSSDDERYLDNIRRLAQGQRMGIVDAREDGFDDGRISKEASDDAKATRLWELSSEIVGC